MQLALIGDIICLFAIYLIVLIVHGRMYVKYAIVGLFLIIILVIVQ